MKTKTAHIIETKKGFFLKYQGTEGVTRTFDTKDQAIDFAKKNSIKITN